MLSFVLKGDMSRYLLSFFKKSANFSRIKWISETIVQFCYLRLYLSIETVSFRLTQRMARMDVDKKVEKVGPTFSSSNAMPAKLTKNIVMVSDCL